MILLLCSTMYACSLVAKWYIWCFKSVLFVGVVAIINPSVLCQLGCCCGFVGVWRYTHILCLASMDVNLCVVVDHCSPIVNFVVAVCIGESVAWAVSSGCHGLPLMFSILYVVGVVYIKYIVVHVRWGLLASHVVSLDSCYVWWCNLICGCGHHKSWSDCRDFSVGHEMMIDSLSWQL